ncbi:PH domain-containing protein [Corynebacterium sp. HS2168-gen11]|uniref:PH domain-containing protein n=1 Tax=Corynebacterium sp. HS2168-gen11 TaxID=2974027 RepID=UPI00216B1D60|nr:PH domain-containing protein [Corynebacterium sp. HS2168-gen11]MCS4535902.1 PH domain-containing protein [Corynebacterium sp. HS2168-gen11]
MDTPIQPVSPHLTQVRYFARLPWIIVPTLASVIWSVFFNGSWWGWSGAGIGLAILIWQLWLIPQQVKNLGWAETEEDLLIQKGKLWKTFTIVPYGRVQYVDVRQGPFERKYGLKTLTLNTASPTSDSHVSGLPAEIADALRDRVALRAKEKMIDL